jgi:CelD/BcsL family acetyltransferase involved in cellulose biosynthesis
VHIDLIEDWEGFHALRADWERVYAADPEAQMFLSWAWMADWLEHCRTPFMVLAAKRDAAEDGYSAFLPLRLRTFFERGGFLNQLSFAGEPFCDYGGFLALPEVEAQAADAFADHIRRKLHWARLQMDNLVMSAARRRRLVAGFSGGGLTMAEERMIDHECGVDNSICPYATLPGDWETYLAGLSANNRQKIRRLLRRLEESADARIAPAAPDEVDGCLKTLLDFWRAKWAWQKGERTEGIIARNFCMLSRCAERGTLYLPVFRVGERMVAALACVVDPVKGAMNFVITGRDETYVDLPAGYLLHAHTIRHAIGLGLTSYDFLRGDEAYKYHFADRERRVVTVTVRAPRQRNLGGRLDPRGFQDMLELAAELEGRDPSEAEKAYREIVGFAPEHGLALYRAARFLFRKGDYGQACTLASRSIAAEPWGDNAWLLLARGRRFLGEVDGALEAYREVLKLRPGNGEAQRAVVELARLTGPARAMPVLAARQTPQRRPSDFLAMAGLGGPVAPSWP